MIFNEENTICIIAGIGILLWFKGMYKILDYLIPNTIFAHIICIIVALVIFYLKDERFYEVGRIYRKTKNEVQNAKLDDEKYYGKFGEKAKSGSKICKTSEAVDENASPAIGELNALHMH